MPLGLLHSARLIGFQHTPLQSNCSEYFLRYSGFCFCTNSGLFKLTSKALLFKINDFHPGEACLASGVYSALDLRQRLQIFSKWCSDLHFSAVHFMQFIDCQQSECEASYRIDLSGSLDIGLLLFRNRANTQQPPPHHHHHQI